MTSSSLLPLRGGGGGYESTPLYLGTRFNVCIAQMADDNNVSEPA